MNASRRPVRRWLALGVIVLFTSGMVPTRADPVAIVVRVQGEVRVQPASGTAATRATTGMQLQAGDRLLVTPGASAVLLYRTGRKVSVTQAMTVEAPAQAERGALFERTVTTLSQVALTSAEQHPNRPGAVRPIPGDTALLTPRRGVKVLSMQPVLHWPAFPGASTYVLQLRRMDERPARFEVSGDTSWQTPPLTPGAEYEWTVAPKDAGGGRVPKLVRFRVVSDAERAAVEASLRELAETGLDPAGDGAFLGAMIYWKAGLLYEALKLLQSLEKDGGGQGRDFHVLYGDVLNGVGDVEGAAHQFAAAKSSG